LETSKNDNQLSYKPLVSLVESMTLILKCFRFEWIKFGHIFLDREELS